MTLPLANRTALVTGASSGLGARIASVFASSGARVALAARRVERLREATREIERDGGTAYAVQMDVTDENSVIAGFEEVEDTWGQIDTVVANAGVSLGGRAVDLDVAAFDRLMATNLRGAFLTVREGARRLLAAGSRKRGHGRVIIVSSVTAQAVYPGAAAYSASKAAVVQLGRVLASEWARAGINVNIVLPGYIATDMTDDLFEHDHGAKLLAGFPRQRLMKTSDFDQIVTLLASDAAYAITGGVFTIDDGQTLR